ncbi:MAG: hypothetical protein HRU19_08860 [Pseudobacteriovorax sp.]|nr:hypothetical protein [Pseudobacteriovorax sp.]
MKKVEWSEDLRLEVARLRSEITPESLKVIPKAIGMNRTLKTKNEIPNNPPDPSTQKPPPSAVSMASSVAKQQKFRTSQFIVKYLCDLVLFSATVLVGYLSYLYFGTGDFVIATDEVWSLFYSPVSVDQKILGITIFFLLFSLYILGFRLVFGKTVGESFVSKGFPAHKALTPADTKASKEFR